MKKNIGIILAGGSGHRIGGEIPKQFIVIAGKTIIEHTLSVFQGNDNIDEIAIIVNPAYHALVQELIKNQFPKVSCLLPGGTERYHSTLSALTAYSETDCNLLIHDSVRPFVTDRIINDVILNLKDYNAVDVAIPTTDTIIEVDETRTYISRIPERARLYQVQTPQGFNRLILQQAFDKALKDPTFQTTDDCSVVKKYLPDEKIKLVSGEVSNIKITWPEDLIYAEKLLSSKL